MPSFVLQDVRHAWRGLRQRPAFLLSALLILGVGIGANITVFSMVNALFLRPLPFGDRTDRLITLHPVHRTAPVEPPGWGDAEISYPDLLDFRRAPSLEALEGYLSRNVVLAGTEADAERVQGGSVTPGLFPALGIEPMLGRGFLPEDAAAPGLESVVMLTHGLWQRRYGGDPSIVGRTIVVNDQARTVVGVLPPRFKFPERDELYLPLGWDDVPRSARNINAVGLLKPGASLVRAREELSATAERLEREFPDTNRGFGVIAVPIRESYVGSEEARVGGILMAAVGFVLLIVCANLANLMLVRGAGRQRELAVRAAIGAGRARLMWSALSESLLLAVCGAALGLLAAQWMLDFFVAGLPEELPFWLTFTIDWRVTLFAVAAALSTGLAVGLLPAFRAARPDLANDLKEAGRGMSLGRGGLRIQAVLSVAQVALCFGLLVGANLMIRSFVAMQTASLGFDDRPVLSARAYLAGDAYDDVRARAAFFSQVVAKLSSLPGVSVAAATTAVPGDDGGSGARLVVDGRTSDDDAVFVQTIGATPGLFDTLGLRMVDGRTFTATEAEDPDVQVAIVGRALAERLWPGARAIDRRIGFGRGDATRWFRVVGVAPDVHYEEVSEATDDSKLNVYVPYVQDGSRSMALLIKANGSPGALAQPVREALASLNVGFPVYRLMPMSELRRLTTWEQEFFGDLMGGFAIVALGLSCLGIYALIAYSVTRRSREFAVRLALGARPRDLVGMLMTQSARVGVAGLAAGLGLALAIANALQGTLYGVTLDGWLFASMALPLAAAILAATALPARRAVRLDPMVAMRDE